MILTLAPGYTSENKNDYGFIHSRIKSYQKVGVESQVFIIARKGENYIFDGVQVNVGSSQDFIHFVNSHSIEAIYVHFIDVSMIKCLQKIQLPLKIIIFIHGNEALWWHERIFPNMFPNLKSFLGFAHYVIDNTYSMPMIRHFVNSTRNELTLVGVSKWMLDVAIKNWKCKAVNCKVIPNIIDEQIFEFHPKNVEQRFNLLSIRSFNSGKYANDITINVILKLSKYPDFQKMKFLLVGDGFLFSELTKKINHLENVTLRREFINHYEISKLHKQYGIFICPTRQDAQGVSMCEAMASGLIPITSNNTAIPEFVPNDLGVVCNTEDEMVQRILDIVRDESLFLNLSKNVAEFISSKCSSDKTTQLEIEMALTAMNDTK